MSQIKTYEDIEKEIIDALNFHKSEVFRFERLLGLVSTDNKVNGTLRAVHETKSASSRKGLLNGQSEQKKSTFYGIIDSILTEFDRPMNIRDLMSEYIKKGGKEIDRKNFSSRLSIESKKKNLFCAKITINNIEEYRWVKKTWLEDGVLKNEYKDKVIA